MGRTGKTRKDPIAFGFDAFTTIELKKLLASKGHQTTAKNKQALISRLLDLSIPVPSHEQVAVLMKDGLQSSSSSNQRTSRTRKKKTINFIRSTNTDTWSETSKDDVSSRIVEMDWIEKKILGKDYRDEIMRLYDAYNHIVASAKMKFPKADAECIVFATVTDELVRCIMRETNPVLKNGMCLDFTNFGEMVGFLIRSNLIELSPSLSWEVSGLATNASIDQAAFSAYIHALRAVSNDLLLVEERDGSYRDPTKLFEAFHEVTNLVNKGLYSLAVGYNLCLDDDHIPFVGNDVDNRSLPSRVDPRKGRGTALNIVTSGVTSIVQAISLEGISKSSPKDIHEKCCLSSGKRVVLDRGYAKLNLAAYLADNQVGMLGILQESSRSEHPVTLVDVPSFDALKTLDISSLPTNSVISFPGVGLESFRYEKSSGVCAVSVINRTSKADHGHIRFIGSGDHMAKEVVEAFVRIPASVPLKEKARMLHLCAKNEDRNAKAIFDDIRDHARLLTETQGTSDWFLCRRTGLTASVASSILKPILKMLPSDMLKTDLKLVYDAFWKDAAAFTKEDAVQTGVSDLRTVITLIEENNPDEQDLAITDSINGESSSTNEESPAVFPSAFTDNQLDSIDDDDDDGSDQENTNNVDAGGDEEVEDFAEEDEEDEENSQSQMPQLSHPIVPTSNTTTSTTTATSTTAATSTTTTTSTTPEMDHAAQQHAFKRHIGDHIVKQSFVSKHRQQDAELAGKLTEPRALHFLEKHMEFIVGSKIFSVGLVASKNVEHLYASPDGVMRIDLRKIENVKNIQTALPANIVNRLSQGGDPIYQSCGLEIKCSIDFPLNIMRAKDVEVVVAGSKEYHEIKELKPEFKVQMLQQAVVMKMEWGLLSAWTRTGPSRTVLVYFPRELHAEYRLLTSHHIVEDNFKWFLASAAVESLSDKEVISKIPSFFSQNSRILLSSHVPLLRAVFIHARKLDELNPFKPTHTFRPGIIAAYDILKGPTDVECRAYADAIKGMTMKTAGIPKITIRLLYTALVAVLKASSIVQYVDKVGGRRFLPESLQKFRHQVRAGSSINDRIWDFGSKVASCRLPFGGLIGSTGPLPPRTPRLSTPVEKVLCAHPNEMMDYLQHRAGEASRSVNESDFVADTGIPISDAAFSATTPGATIFKHNFVGMTESLAKFFTRRPPPNAARTSKLQYWIAGDGSKIRTNTLIAHVVANMNYRGSKCFWCQERPGSTWVTCLFCGEEFCSKCIYAFHNDRQDLERLVVKSEEETATDSTTTSTTGISSDKYVSQLDWKTPRLVAESKRSKNFPMVQDKDETHRNLSSDFAKATATVNDDDNGRSKKKRKITSNN